LGRPMPNDFFALHKREPTAATSTIRIVAHTHLIAHLEFRDELAGLVRTIALTSSPPKRAALWMEIPGEAQSRAGSCQRRPYRRALSR
jgi:hypothetical protein